MLVNNKPYYFYIFSGKYKKRKNKVLRLRNIGIIKTFFSVRVTGMGGRDIMPKVCKWVLIWPIWKYVLYAWPSCWIYVANVGCEAWSSLSHILKAKEKSLEVSCSNPPYRTIWHIILSIHEIDEKLNLINYSPRQII